MVDAITLAIAGMLGAFIGSLGLRIFAGQLNSLGGSRRSGDHGPIWLGGLYFGVVAIVAGLVAVVVASVFTTALSDLIAVSLVFILVTLLLTATSYAS